MIDKEGGQQNFTAKGYALWAGDFNADARIIKNGANNDVNHVIATIFSDSLNSRHQLDYVSRGYSTQDVNLDGKVIYQGKNNEVEYINTAILSHPQNTKGLKNHVIEEQLPTTMNATAATMVTLDALQTVDYRYHIRGGLLGINLDASGLPVPNTSQGDLFAYKLEYETAGRWDGNIGKQTWTNVQNVQRNYSFTYDGESLKFGKTSNENGLKYFNSNSYV